MPVRTASSPTAVKAPATTLFGQDRSAAQRRRPSDCPPTHGSTLSKAGARSLPLQADRRSVAGWPASHGPGPGRHRTDPGRRLRWRPGHRPGDGSGRPRPLQRRRHAVRDGARPAPDRGPGGHRTTVAGAAGDLRAQRSRSAAVGVAGRGGASVFADLRAQASIGRRQEERALPLVAPDQRHAYDFAIWRAGGTYRGRGLPTRTPPSGRS